MEKRESFSSRLGFLLISAGCAIGLGNVWRFPYITGQYGGAAFVLLYLLFLVALGLPVLSMELAVGRASQRSMALSFHVLEPKGTKWHWYSYVGFAGNYLLMMFYTVIAGWLLYYFVKTVRGDFVGLDPQQVTEEFAEMQADPVVMTVFMAIVVVVSMLVCSRGLRNGVERVNKAMMLCLLALMVVLAVNSIRLEGAGEGLRFYLQPNFRNLVYDDQGRPTSPCPWASGPSPSSAATSAGSTGSWARRCASRCWIPAWPSPPASSSSPPARPTGCPRETAPPWSL